jgi:hypothetical protein
MWTADSKAIGGGMLKSFGAYNMAPCTKDARHRATGFNVYPSFQMFCSYFSPIPSYFTPVIPV